MVRSAEGFILRPFSTGVTSDSRWRSIGESVSRLRGRPHPHAFLKPRFPAAFKMRSGSLFRGHWLTVFSLFLPLHNPPGFAFPGEHTPQLAFIKESAKKDHEDFRLSANPAAPVEHQGSLFASPLTGGARGGGFVETNRFALRSWGG